MEQYTAALAGNPNVGKSTVFNTLPGMRQHTGNWPGKTVAVAEGACTWQGAAFRWWRTPPASGETCSWRCSCAAARRGW